MSARVLLLAAALGAIACGGSPDKTDSTLARDLALANQPTASVPELNDTALTKTPSKAPATKRATPQPRPAPAQDPTPPPVSTAAPDVAPTPPPAAQPVFRGIATGTTFALRTKSQVCTGRNLPGDKFTATVLETVVGENGATIPAGSVVVLEVAEVIPGDKPENARVVLRIRTVFVNDQQVAVPSEIAITSELERSQLPRDKGADRRKVVGGAVAGAIVGQIMGKDTKSTVTGAAVGAAAGAVAAGASAKYDACLPAGGSLRATTTQPVPISG